MQGPGAQLAFVTRRVTLLFGSSDDEQERAASTSGEIAIMRRKRTLSPVGAAMLNRRHGVLVTSSAVWPVAPFWPLRRLAVAPFGRCALWPLRRLAVAPFGRCAVWPLRRLAVAPVGRCAVSGRCACLAVAPFGRCAVWPLRRLAALRRFGRCAVWPWRRFAVAPFGRCAVWPLRRLAVAPLRRCAVAPLRRLAVAPFGRCAVWPLRRLAVAPFGRCAVWPLRRLAVAPFGRCAVWPGFADGDRLEALSAEPPRSLRLLRSPNARTECRDDRVVGDGQIRRQRTVAFICSDGRRLLDRANNPDGHGEPARETRFSGGCPAVVHANAYLTDSITPRRRDDRNRIDEGEHAPGQQEVDGVVGRTILDHGPSVRVGVRERRLLDEQRCWVGHVDSCRPVARRVCNASPTPPVRAANDRSPLPVRSRELTGTRAPCEVG